MSKKSAPKGKSAKAVVASAAKRAKQSMPEQEEEVPLLGSDSEGISTDIELEPAPPPTDEELGKVAALAALQIEIMGRIARGEAMLSLLGQYLRDVSERQLPMAMQSIRMKDFALDDGSSVVVEDFAAASIKKDNQTKAFAFLEDYGAGDLIKHTLTVKFGKGEDKWAKKFMADLAKRKRPLDVERKDAVAANTLSAWLRKELAALRAKGIDPYTKLSKELLGIYEGSRSAITLSPATAKALEQSIEQLLRKEQNNQLNSGSAG